MVERSLLAFTLVLSLSLPSAAAASTVWPTWGISGNDITASFTDGRVAVLTGFPIGIVPANGGFTTVPDLPGIAAGGHPEYPNVWTGSPHPTTLAPGDVVLSLDLAGFPVDAETLFGVVDLFYDLRLEILDAGMNALSLNSVLVSQYNVFYLSGAIGDYDILLDPSTGLLTRNQVHDANAGSTYTHAGLTLFSNLPPDTAFVRLVSPASQPSEGLRILFGATSVPEPGVAGLLACGLLVVAWRTVRGT